MQTSEKQSRFGDVIAAIYERDLRFGVGPVTGRLQALVVRIRR